MSSLIGDGSAASDTHPRVEIDLEDFVDRQRYRCPNGHASWTPTNSHLWCKSCSDAAEHGGDVEPEHWEVLDLREERLVPWSAVEVV